MAVFGQGDALKKLAKFLRNISMKMVLIVLGRLFLGLLPKNIGLGVVLGVEKNLMGRKIKKRVKLSLNTLFQEKSSEYLKGTNLGWSIFGLHFLRVFDV
jgi:hypothetical protein